MTLDQIPPGTDVFLDANTLIYHFVGDVTYGPLCTRLIERIEQNVKLDMVLSATKLSRHYELLSGDALIVAVMQQQGLVDIASGGTDFDRVPGIQRLGPV